MSSLCTVNASTAPCSPSIFARNSSAIPASSSYGSSAAERPVWNQTAAGQFE